jgi:hypothetical protein
MSILDFTLYKGAWINQSAPHKNHRINDSECHILLKGGGLLVRNDYDFDLKEETSFWYIIKDSFGGMEELSTNVRNMVRRAQKTLDIHIISKEEMLLEGFEVYLAAFENYKVKADIPNKESYLNRINKCKGDYHFWGCFDKETKKMIAFSINHIFDNQCNYETFKALPTYLKGYYPFYGLLYEMNRYYLDEMKLLYVCDGARSITEHSNIQPFLIQKFKFRQAYCKIQIEYVWWMKIAVFLLYPVKHFINNGKVKSILNMEAMRRGVI